MAFRSIRNESSNGDSGDLVSSGAIPASSVVFRDTSAKAVKVATSSVGTLTNVCYVSGALASGASATVLKNAIPIVFNASQLWEVDCTNATAADQLHIAHALTDGATLNNTSTHSATGFFVADRLGSTSTKLIGHFINVNA